MPDIPPEHPPGDPPEASSQGNHPIRASLTPRFEDDPPTRPNRGLPSWAWTIIIIFLVIVGLPILLIGGLFLYCMFASNSFHVGP